MKNVLLLIHDDEGQEARLQAALDLTRALDGHLSCIDVTLSSAKVGEYYSLGVAPATLIRDECEGEGRNKIMLEARLEHEDVPWDWADATGDLVDGVCESGQADRVEAEIEQDLVVRHIADLELQEVHHDLRHVVQQRREEISVSPIRGCQ